MIPENYVVDGALKESAGEDGSCADGEDILLAGLASAFIGGDGFAVPVNRAGAGRCVKRDNNLMPLADQRIR